MEKQFNLMIRQLQSNEYLKKDFISNVSHEFKTPLSVINGYAELLTEDSLSDSERKEYASLIVAESRRLTTLTGNILCLSKLNRDQVPLSDKLFSMTFSAIHPPSGAEMV
ncbi:MAG: histidine kinase dimerization/phospho-acceptor domain-containing protein [Eubacterium sp.]